MTITPQALNKVFPAMNAGRAAALAAAMNQVFPGYQINSPARVSAFVAQVGHESANFSAKEENLNYSGDRLMVVFPRYFNAATAAQYSRQPQKIANRIYANRMGNGDEASGDGFAYRGGGFIQLTGKDMYQNYANYLKKDLATTANLIRTDDTAAMDSACWFFATFKQLLDEADAGDFITMTKKINGGTIGLDDRQRLYALAKQAFAGQPATA